MSVMKRDVEEEKNSVAVTYGKTQLKPAHASRATIIVARQL